MLKATDKISILAICGSLRQGSYNKMLLQAAQRLAPAGAAIESFDLQNIPIFNQDLENDLPSAVKELKNKIRASDAILLVTPEYNYSISGVLKNAIDWASRPYGDNSWNGKPVALMGASSGMFGTVRAQLHLRQCFIFLNMLPLNQPEFYFAKAQDRFEADGELKDQADQEIIVKLLNALIDWAAKNEAVLAASGEVSGRLL